MLGTLKLLWFRLAVQRYRLKRLVLFINQSELKEHAIVICLFLKHIFEWRSLQSVPSVFGGPNTRE